MSTDSQRSDAALATPGRTPDETELLAALGDNIERFAASHIDARRIDREARIPRPVLGGLAELGLFGLSLPAEHGGAELSLQAVCAAIANLARRDRAVATTVGLHLGLGTRGLVAFGSERLRARYLPDLAAGRRIAAFATTEAEAGSDLQAIRTRAVEDRPGRLRVEGTKIYVTNGGLADVFTITASSPGLGGARRGHSLLLVERGDAGVQPSGEEHKLGLRGSSTTTVHFDGVDLPLDRIIGAAGRGMEHLAHVLAWGRTAMAAGCVGAARAALEAASAHVATRRQFGRALIAFEVVREQLADMAALAFAMESLVRYTCAIEDDHNALALRSTSAKVFCSEASGEIADLAVQLHGGAGFIEETGIPLLLRDARITRIFEGANDVLCVHAGTTFAAAPLPRTPLAEHAPASPLAVAGDAIATRIDERRRELLDRHGVRLMGQQRLLHRLGRLAVLRDATDAVVRRAAVDPDPAAAPRAAHFLAIAGRRVDALLREPPDRAPVDAITRSLHPEIA